jgi:hypothetical protein
MGFTLARARELNVRPCAKVALVNCSSSFRELQVAACNTTAIVSFWWGLCRPQQQAPNRAGALARRNNPEPGLAHMARGAQRVSLLTGIKQSFTSRFASLCAKRPGIGRR